MTLQEFRDEVTSMSDLYSFCMDNGYENYFEDIVDEDGFYSWVDETYLPDLMSNCSWEDIISYLLRAKDLYGSYYWFDIYSGDPDGIDETGRRFRDILSEVESAAIDDGFFDDGEDEEEVSEEIRYTAYQTQVCFGTAVEEKTVEESYEEPVSDIGMTEMLTEISQEEYKPKLIPINKTQDNTLEVIPEFALY